MLSVDNSQVSASIHRIVYWFRNPTPQPVATPGEHDPLTWLNYDTDDYNYVYLSREDIATHQAYRQHQYAFFREYVPYLVLRDEVPSF